MPHAKKKACLECGGTMKVRRENVKYDASGLPGVTLADVVVSRCVACGEVEVSIPNIEGLHKTIALVLAQKRERLVGVEVRFLRKYLGFSGTDFASHIGVAPETVSRWEQGVSAMGLAAERLLRWMVVTRDPISHYPLDMLTRVAVDDPKVSRIAMRVFHGEWQPARELSPA